MKGWDKTWAYLKALGENIEYYPSGTGAVMKELGEGSRDMTVSTTGWDINPRVLGVVPKEAKVGAIKGFHWVTDAHYMCVPKGVPNDKLAVLLDLMSFLLTKQQQAYTYDEGYFYPGPAVKGVTLDMAPEESQKAIKEFGRPEYDKLIAEQPDRDAARSRPDGAGLPALGRGGRRRQAQVTAQVKEDVILGGAKGGDPRTSATGRHFRHKVLGSRCARPRMTRNVMP